MVKQQSVRMDLAAIAADLLVIRSFASPAFVCAVGNQRPSTSSFRPSMSWFCGSHSICTARFSFLSAAKSDARRLFMEFISAIHPNFTTSH
jgi:hypothetical protein